MSENVLKKIVKHYDGNDIASNELLVNIVLNRVFRKLFENDKELIVKADEINGGLYRVLPWDETKTYNKNDLVWYVDVYAPPAKEEEYNAAVKEIEENNSDPIIIKQKIKFLQDRICTVTLYLLRSLKNNNTSRPQRTLVDMVPLFDVSGWKNENPMGSIYTDFFEDFTVDNITRMLREAHETIQTYHKFGKLEKFDDIKEKILENKMPNIDPTRKKVFFANTTFALKESKTVISGSCRKWDCGLLEYDITYKLGDSDVEYSAYNADGTVKLRDDLDANYLRLGKRAVESLDEGDIYDNRRYYLNDDDSTIFVVANDATIAEAGITQHNINDKINSYCGTIKFDVPFIDTNYSIFPEAISGAITAEENIVKNINSMVFVNKCRNSVTALLVIPNYGGSEYRVLGENTFRCRITGRWK